MVAVTPAAVLAAVPKLALADLERLAEAVGQAIKAKRAPPPPPAPVDPAPACPHCQTADPWRWGSAGGTRRWRCRGWPYYGGIGFGGFIGGGFHHDFHDHDFRDRDFQGVRHAGSFHAGGHFGGGSVPWRPGDRRRRGRSLYLRRTVGAALDKVNLAKR
jgi:hypothetical protein